MPHRSPLLKFVYFSLIFLVAALLGFQLIINFSGSDAKSLNADSVEDIKQTLQVADSYEFAVVGEVNNSLRVFRDQILPAIGTAGADFAVSAGNFVSAGTEEGYNAAISILNESALPFVLTYGVQENEDFGSYRFYERFGPHFFAFTAGNTHFIFLDITGKTPKQWQLEWFDRELGVPAENKFVFVGAPLQAPAAEISLPTRDQDDAFREELTELIAKHQPDGVFSAGRGVLDQQQVDGVPYIITGGAGGFIVDNENSYHHFVMVSVTDDQVEINPVAVEIARTPWVSTLDSVWSALYTLFYVSYPRFLLWIGILSLVALRLHETLFTERNYYRRFEIDPGQILDKPKRVAFFTNNYFPFVSGVTLSIERLRSGLRASGNRVHLFVPDYGQSGGKEKDKSASDDSCDENVTRLHTLWAFGHNREFRMVNLFSARVLSKLRSFKPDIIHVHHPFWLGSLGLFLGQRLNIPVVYTYHTRLEQYAHYVPLPSQIFRNFISHWLVKRFCNKCAGVIVPTVSVDEYLRAIGVRTPIMVQSTGIDHEQFSQPDDQITQELAERWQLKPGEIVLITVSRLGREKNIDFVLDGIHSLIKKTDKPFRLLIVGQGDEYERLQARINSEDLSEHVLLTGSVKPEEMANAYHLADIFVFASRSETQGMVLLEAMSAGLPVVAVRSSGIDDVIRPGETGYKTRERVNEWADKIAELIEQEEQRMRMAAAAITLAKQHDISHFTSNINYFYSEILALRESA